MLSSISPVGEAARRQRWIITVAAYWVGSAGAGAALGGVLGLVGTALLPAANPSWYLLALGILGAAGLAADRTSRVPSLHRQVDRLWLDRYRGWVYGFGFGAQLGLGVVTIIPASVVWVMWSAALLTRSPAAGSVIGLTFGLARAVPLVLAGRIRSVDGLRRLLAAFERHRAATSRATAAGHALVTVTAIGVGMVSAFR